MNHIGNFAVKVEGSATGAPNFEIPVANTKINEWEELTYDFSVVPDNGEYKRITVFVDLGIDATGADVTSYFDDIVLGDGSCQMVNVFNPGPVETMKVSPNPVTDELNVRNFEGVVRIDIMNVFGQRVASISTNGENQTDINVTQLPAGVYALTGFNKQGLLIGNAKFVKQ